MGYVLLVRNPKNQKLVAIVDDDHGNMSEFSTYDEAVAAADETTLCKAWGYEVVEVAT